MRLRFLLAVVSSTFLLTACDPRTQAERGEGSSKSILDMLSKEGPAVDGVQATVLTSAKEAEKNRQYDRALQFYRQLHDQDKANVAYTLGVADNLRRTDANADALRGYQEVLAKEPQNIDALEGSGLAQLATGDTKAAKSTFEQVLAIDKNRWRTLNAVGILFAMNGMADDSLAYFNQALAVAPDEPAVLNNVGLTLALNHDYPRAIETLEHASSALASDKLQAERSDLNLALVYGLAGDMDNAERVASKHLNESALNNNLGFYAELQKNDDLAKAYLNSALAGSPVFYNKAWNNLEAIGGASLNSNRTMKKTPGSAAMEKEPVSKPITTVTSAKDEKVAKGKKIVEKKADESVLEDSGIPPVQPLTVIPSSEPPVPIVPESMIKDGKVEKPQ